MCSVLSLMKYSMKDENLVTIRQAAPFTKLFTFVQLKQIQSFTGASYLTKKECVQ